MAELNIDSIKNDNFEFADVVEVINKFELCLVGRFIIEKNLNVRAIKARLADIRKPTIRISIKEIEDEIFFFSFIM